MQQQQQQQQQQNLMSLPTFPIALPSEFDEKVSSVPLQPRNDEICPIGFICNDTHIADCVDIQNFAIDGFKIGDIHGGAWCPLGSPYYLNCPVGHFCPDPVSATVLST